MLTRSAAWLLPILAACSGATAPARKVGPMQVQFAFFHFQDDHVRVTVDGETRFDRAVTVAPDNARLGLAAVAQIALPECSNIVVTSRTQRLAKRLCLTAQTKSIVVDGGPPLTIAAEDKFQGVD